MQALRILDHDATALADMSKEDMLQAFSNCFRITEDALVAASAIMEQWKKNGWETEDLERVAGKWLHRLRLIASGQLLPKLAVRFDGQPSMLDRFARLPVDDQRLIVNDEPIEVLTYAPGGDATKRMLPPSTIMADRLLFKQVFDKDRIRTDRQQAAWLDGERRKSHKAKPDKVGHFNLDRVRAGVTHRGEFIPLHELVAAVKALRQK
jgi:hypothetical protein